MCFEFTKAAQNMVDDRKTNFHTLQEDMFQKICTSSKFDLISAVRIRTDRTTFWNCIVECIAIFRLSQHIIKASLISLLYI